MNVERIIVTRPAYPAIYGVPVGRRYPKYPKLSGLGLYGTVQTPTDMAVKTAIGGGIGYLGAAFLGVPYGVPLGAAIGLGTTLYNNWKLRRAAAAAGTAGYGCGCC